MDDEKEFINCYIENRPAGRFTGRVGSHNQLPGERGQNPAAVFKFIASGVFGKRAFAAGTSMVVWGVLFHFLIAFLFTVFFFWLYPRISWIGKNKVIAGLFYGLFVWAVMSLLVVPISNTPSLPPGTFLKKVVSMLILLFCAGLPVSLLANRYYLYKK